VREGLAHDPLRHRGVYQHPIDLSVQGAVMAAFQLDQCRGVALDEALQQQRIGENG